MGTDTSINHSTVQNCYAVKVRSQGESRVAYALRQKGHQVLLPGYVQCRRYSDRVQRVPCALFPGYVFVRMDEGALLSVVSTFGVHYVVGFGSKLEPLPEHEAKAVEVLCEANDQNDQCEPCEIFTVGQRAMIIEGLFSGLVGVLQKVQDQTRVVISIDSLQKAVRISLPSSSFRIL